MAYLNLGIFILMNLRSRIYTQGALAITAQILEQPLVASGSTEDEKAWESSISQRLYRGGWLWATRGSSLTSPSIQDQV